MNTLIDLFPSQKFPNLTYEQGLGFPTSKIIGLDEVGRGCLAGPVVACAVILPHTTKNFDPLLEQIQDSKKLTEKKREALYLPIQSFVKEYSIGSASSEEIDQMNIFQATFLAMKRALIGLKTKASEVLIDGKFAPKDLPQYKFTPVIKGDEKSLSIACASILAKVYRDRLVKEYDLKHPQYFFSKHKGYGTALHLNAIKEHGVLSFHRRSFAPVRAQL